MNTVKLEAVPYRPSDCTKLIELVIAIESRAETTREDVAFEVNETPGFRAHKGGRHVGIIDRTTGERVAIVTGTSADWS